MYYYLSEEKLELGVFRSRYIYSDDGYIHLTRDIRKVDDIVSI
jgi:hypothetical protein